MLQPPPTGLFAEVSAAGDARPGGPPAECGPWSVSDTPSLQVAVRAFADVQTLRDEARGVEVVVHGQLLDGMTLPRLVDSYLDRGPSFLKDCNGSFSLLLVDRGGDAVLAATDRLQSRPLHVREDGGRTYLSSKLADLVTPTSSPDRAGVAWYLSSGVVHTARTVLEEVSRVPCASFILLSRGRREISRYWRFDITREYAGTPPDQLRDQAADILVGCVRKRLGDGDGPLLSLSAGHDARGILGILTHVLHVDGLETFSYGATEGVPDSDATLAAHLAEMRGVPHRFLPSYDGDFDDVIERNALWGDGSANFCDEALMWDRLVDRHQARRPPLFLGDTAFDSSEYEVVTVQDVLDDCAMGDFAGLSWLEKLLPRGQYRELRDAQAPDLHGLARMVQGMDDTLDMMGLLYLEEYIPRRLLPWRECYAARGFTIQEPLLDNDILDFTGGLPPELRREKRLYVEAATALDPDLFAVPRAEVSGCFIDWRNELRCRAASLAASCARGEGAGQSLLDDIIDPGVVRATLALPRFRGDGQAREHAAGRVLRRGWRQVRRKVRGRQLPLYIGPVEFLLRYLVLRRFLQIAGPTSLLTRLQAADGATRRPPPP